MENTIVAFIGAYCISSITLYVLILLLGQQLLLINLFMNIVLVTGLTYFAMPLLSRLLDDGYTQKTVLDISTGVKEPAITAAGQMGKTGHILATDISPQMLSVARRRAVVVTFNF